MADLYSVIAGIQPDQQDILEAELLAKQILEANFQELDLREGTGIRDLVLRPSAFLLALCKKGYDAYFAQNTLAGVTDTTPTEIVDDLMGNLFLTRNLGTYAVINARLYFARAKNVSLTQDISFSTDGKILFYPLQNAAFSSSALSYDSYHNEWYIDVDLQAESPGTNYNIGEGSLLYFTNFDPYFLHAEINYLRESSTESETNSQFLSRASTSISTRNLINKPSILSNLAANFNTIPNIISIGAGDEEMYRDLVKVKMDPLAAVAVTNISFGSGLVTVYLPNHGFVTGQSVVVSGANPGDYNGTFVVTVVNTGTFTYHISTSAATATVLPTIQAVETDLYLHQGGTVDVYCDSDLITKISQHTLDGSGVAEIDGPVIKIVRSSVSGGSSADTVPLAPVVSYLSHDPTDHTKFYSTASGLVTGDVVAISGMEQSVSVTSMVCNPGSSYVTATCPGHPISSLGSLITIAGAFPVEYNGDFVGFYLDANTFTYSVPTRISLAASGTMVVKNRGLTMDQYPSGTAFGGVTQSGSYFNVAMPNLWTGVAITGTTPVITHEPPFTVSYPSHTSRNDVVFQVNSSTPQTKNQLYMPGNPLSVGRYVQISGSTNALNNQTWKVDSRLDADTVNIVGTVDNGYVAGTGFVTAKFVNPVLDTGFSTRQVATISYGSAQANRTVSLQTTSFSNVANVQQYLESPTNRVLCGDLLARGFDVYLLDISLTVYNSAAPTTGQAQLLINKYLTSLTPGSVFLVSELVAMLNAGGIINLRTPVSITATFHQRDMFPFAPTQILDVFSPGSSMSIYLLNSVATSSMAV